jgi:hypothetical protein
VKDTEAKKDARARTKICLSVKAVTYVHVQVAKTLKVPWVILQKAYESKDLKRWFHLLRTLICVKLDLMPAWKHM